MDQQSLSKRRRDSNDDDEIERASSTQQLDKPKQPRQEGRVENGATTMVFASHGIEQPASAATNNNNNNNIDVEWIVIDDNSTATKVEEERVVTISSDSSVTSSAAANSSSSSVCEPVDAIVTHPTPETAAAMFRHAMKPILRTLGDGDGEKRLQVSGEGAAHSLSSPGLSVKGTNVTIPLTEESAAVLRAEGVPSPFGHGVETKVDPKVRNSLEFGADDVTFTCPSWADRVESVAKEACKKLGLNAAEAGNVRCSLWKALYYPTGSFFKPHQDTEKEPGMFATLVVCLPSTFTGGELAVTHLKTTTKHTFGEVGVRSETAQFVCFFADVMHEVLPVTSGDRVVLTYNLTWVPTAALRAPPKLSFSDSTMRAAVSAIQKDFTPAAEPAFFGLEHDYTDISLAFGAMILKGRDKVVYTLLSHVAAGSGAKFFLGRRQQSASYMASEECGVSWGNSKYYKGANVDELMWEEREAPSAPTLSLKSLDGKNEKKKKTDPAWMKAITVDTQEVMFLPGVREVWPERWAHHDYDGYLGNEAPMKFSRYHSYVLAMIPLNMMN